MFSCIENLRGCEHANWAYFLSGVVKLEFITVQGVVLPPSIACAMCMQPGVASVGGTPEREPIHLASKRGSEECVAHK